MKESPKDYSTPRVQKYQERKKQSQLKVKVPFLRKSPKRLMSDLRTNVSRAIKFTNTLESPRTKAKIVSKIVETVKSSPCTKHLLEFSSENPHTEKFQNSKKKITNLRGRKDNGANIAGCIIIGSVVGKASNRSMRSNCKRLGVSFQTLKRAISDANNFDNAGFITHKSPSHEKTVLTEETKAMVTNFYKKVA